MPSIVATEHLTGADRVVAPATRTTVFLTTDRVTKMLADRRSFQIVKFRTNCSDCVPNL
jgi:hypothetical protein